MNLSTCTRHIMTSYFFKEIELTITCVNMEEMTKTVSNNLFGKLLCSL